MELSQARYADVIVAKVTGRVDHANADHFKSDLWQVLIDDRDQQAKLVLDLSGLEYISSAGLRVLMLAARRVKLHEGSVVVAAPQPVVKEVFEITRFNLLFRMFDTVPAALAELSPAAAQAYAAS